MEIRIGDLVIGTGPGSRQQALHLAGVYLAERERTKRLLVGAACFFVIVAAFLVVFAPEDRETLANVCGVALVVVALGAIGVSKFKLKLPGIQLDTGGSASEREAENSEQESPGD